MPLSTREQEALYAWHVHGQNITVAAQHLGIPRTTFRDRLHSAQEKEQLKTVIELPQTKKNKTLTKLPGVTVSPDAQRRVAVGNTFVLTSAQSNTKVHPTFWKSLLKYCAHNGAELHVSRFTYNKDSLGAKGGKPGKKKDKAEQDTWFDPKIMRYVSDESLQLAPGLIWCGELNIIPTRVNPISGFQGYTGLASSILPHAKMAMESVPNMKFQETKQVFTTGTVTLRNYIKKAAGQKADFHHVFGAIVVEVDQDGTWWARQLNAQSDGTFYDLNKFYTPTSVQEDIRVQAITHGDIHGLKLNHEIKAAVFKPNGILDTLRPKEQFFHDLIDFMPRNHHNIHDPHFLYKMWKDNTSCVETEFDVVAQWLVGDDYHAFTAYRDWCDTHVVVSNHDQAIELWLRNIAALKDPENLLFWHKMNVSMLESEDPHAFEQALRMSIAKCGDSLQDRVSVIREDESYRILDEIEAGLHGHLGSNGSRGSPRTLSNAGKANTGHTHSSGIFQGVYTAGVYGDLDMKYNKGLSAWSHGMVVTYPNAKRAILTIKKGRAWR